MTFQLFGFRLFCFYVVKISWTRKQNQRFIILNGCVSVSARSHFLWSLCLSSRHKIHESRSETTGGLGVLNRLPAGEYFMASLFKLFSFSFSPGFMMLGITKSSIGKTHEPVWESYRCNTPFSPYFCIWIQFSCPMMFSYCLRN